MLHLLYVIVYSIKLLLLLVLLLLFFFFFSFFFLLLLLIILLKYLKYKSLSFSHVKQRDTIIARNGLFRSIALIAIVSNYRHYRSLLSRHSIPQPRTVKVQSLRSSRETPPSVSVGEWIRVLSRILIRVLSIIKNLSLLHAAWSVISDNKFIELHFRVKIVYTRYWVFLQLELLSNYI